MLSGPVIEISASPLQVMCFYLVVQLSLGVVRNSLALFYPQWSLSVLLVQQQHKKLFG